MPHSRPGFGGKPAVGSPAHRRNRGVAEGGLPRGVPRLPAARGGAEGYLEAVPELPEVEVTRRRIGPLLVGRRIARVATTRPSYFFLTRPAALRAGLVGREIRALARRGKYLVAELDDAARLVLHLGMTGQLFSARATSPRLLSAGARSALRPEEQLRFSPDLHTHLRLAFADGGP